MPRLDDDTVDELTWRISAAIGASVPAILRPHLEKNTKILVAVLVSRNGMQVKVEAYTGDQVALLLQWDAIGDLDVNRPCFYCARPATYRDLITQNQVCRNCAEGRLHHESL